MPGGSFNLNLKTTSIALVGPGLVGRRHLQLLIQASHVSVAGTVSPDPDFKVPDRPEIEHFQTVSDLLRETRPDGVVIASPTQFHANQAAECLRASIPVLVEKPVGQSASEITELIKLSENHNVPVCVGHHRIHGALFKRLQGILRSQKFGVCHHFVAKTIFRKPPQYWVERDWRTLPANGGVIGINLIHDLDIAQRLFGPIQEVCCDLVEHPSHLNLVSRGQALARFENGTQGAFIFSDGSAASASWELTTAENPGFHKHDDACYGFYFEDGYLTFPEFRFAQGAKLNWLSEIKSETMIVEPDDPLKNQIAHFQSVIEGREAPKVTLADALQNRRVMDALFRSAETGRWVAVLDKTELMP